MTRRIVVFLGPSLGVQEAQTILPATYLPPARQSDLLSAVRHYQPDIICLIDGEFGQSLAVWHKEILSALHGGVQVYGAASMGALRAAETHQFGMIGVGRVFNMYRSGALTDDDEVALTYAPPELGYASLSLPMVNIRATLSAAVESGTFKQELADTLIAAAKGLYFPDRTVQLLCEHALLGEADSQTVKALFSSFYVDVKREDTIRLLDSVRRNAFDGKLGQPQFSLNESKYFRAQMQQDRWTDIDGARVTQSEICKHVALHHGGFDAMRERALTKPLLMIFAAHIGLKVSADELELERTIFLSERGLESAAAVTVWRESNDMTETEWEELLTELATVRRLSKWFIARQGRLRITKPLLDELKLSGNYPRWARSAAHKQQIIGELPPETGSRNDRAASVLELMKDQHLNGEWPLPVDIFEWMELSGFDNIDELRQELSLNAYFRSRKLGAEK